MIYLLCAALLAAAPLRAADTDRINSPDQAYSMQLPEGWPSGPAQAKLTPPGMTQLFSLSPRSKAFVMNVSYDKAGPEESMLLKTYYETAREIAGGAFPEESVPAGGGRFVCFRSSGTAAGLRRYLVQGVLYGVGGKYYVTFSSTKGWPSGADWQAALGALATLSPGSADAVTKPRSVPTRLPPTGMDDGSSRPLAETPALRADGRSMKFGEIIVFACNGIPNNRYLFNHDRSRQCWIKNPADFAAISAKLGAVFGGTNTVFFDECPPELKAEKFCDPAKLRDF